MNIRFELDEEQVRQALKEYLKNYLMFGIIESNDYSISVYHYGSVELLVNKKPVVKSE